MTKNPHVAWLVLGLSAFGSACSIRDGYLREEGGAAGVAPFGAPAATGGLIGGSSAGRPAVALPGNDQGSSAGGTRNVDGGAGTSGTSGARESPDQGGQGGAHPPVGDANGIGAEGAAAPPTAGASGRPGSIDVAGGAAGHSGQGGAISGGVSGGSVTDTAGGVGGTSDGGTQGGAEAGRTENGGPGGRGDAGSGGPQGGAGAGSTDSAGAAGDAGAAGATPLMAQFRGGPCVVSPPESRSAYVYGRGSDERIYRSLVTAEDQSEWEVVSALDGALLSDWDESDLDCSADPNEESEPVIHIVGLGGMPTGSLFHASGFDLQFSPLAGVSVSGLFDSSPAVMASLDADGYSLGIKSQVETGMATGITWIDVDSGGHDDVVSLTAPVAGSLVSGVECSYHRSSSGSRAYFFAAYDDSGALQVNEYVDYTVSQWVTSPESFEPPQGRVFQYSPAICTLDADYAAEGSSSPMRRYRHLVGVAQNRLWYAAESSTGWSAWEQIGAIRIASAPDCAVTRDGAVHVVARSSSGSVVHVRMIDGDSAETDLGVFE